MPVVTFSKRRLSQQLHDTITMATTKMRKNNVPRFLRSSVASSHSSATLGLLESDLWPRLGLKATVLVNITGE